MFHLLRRQLHRNFRKPLIVMSPKSMLRLPAAASSLDDLIKGSFREVLFEKDALDPAKVKRIVFCTGKVYYDLLAARRERKLEQVALIRLEELYPFPEEQVREVLDRYGHAQEIVWAQEEPKNMGSWFFVAPLLHDLLPKKARLRYVGRPAAASPAVGSHHIHDHEQKHLVNDALS
jgi:2-oxoglutarate dehydrogenase E1 component